MNKRTIPTTRTTCRYCVAMGSRIGDVPSVPQRELFQIMSSLHTLLIRMKKLFSSPLRSSLENRHEIEILYFDRTNEFLMMTSERMVIPDEGCTLEQVLNRLRERGDRWAYELDDRHAVCTVNGEAAAASAAIKPGVEIGIFSRKSIFET